MSGNIRIISRGSPIEAYTMDFLVTPYGLDETQSLESAVIVALCTDRRANDDDILPNPRDNDRRGWWADADAEEIWERGPIGSRLWLLRRSKITDAAASEGALIARVQDYIREAIQPFLTAGIASRMQVSVVRTALQTVEASLVLFRGPKKLVDLRYQVLWDEVA